MNTERKMELGVSGRK